MRAVTAICVLAVLGACAPSSARTRGSSPPPPPGTRVPDADPGPRPAYAPSDADFIDHAPGVSLRGLSRGERAAVFAILNTEPSACRRPHSLAQSLRDDPGCHDSRVLAQYIADSMKSGVPSAEIKQGIPTVLTKLAPRAIEVTGRPVYGDPDAPVTVVVFADFECPHCRMEASRLREAIDRSRGKARLVFKHFPLSSHAMAKPAAIATAIAHAHGKFWALHDLVFANQQQLSAPRLIDLAIECGLDESTFTAEMAANVGADTVEADLAEGRELGITGTPTVFVDGREVNEALFGGTAEGWIDDAIRRN